jgi:hypothetical protein
LYGWKCQDARAAVSESSVLVAHFDDHFVEKSVRVGGADEKRKTRRKKIIHLEKDLKIKSKFRFLQKVKNRHRREENERKKISRRCRQTRSISNGSM